MADVSEELSGVRIEELSGDRTRKTIGGNG